MIPSRRCYVLLAIGGLGAALLDILIDRQVSLNFLRIYDFTLLVGTIVDASQVKESAIEVTRQKIERISVGRENLIELKIKSGKARAIALIRDSFPQQFAVNIDSLEVNLPPNSSKELTYTINPDSRGEYQWGDIQVRQLGKFGLAWRDWKIPASQKVTIYPDLISLKELSIRLTLENAGAMRQARRLGNGTEFAELREYRTGEDIRLIDWKATARRDRPVVRVLEPEQEQTLLILLDRGRLMTARVSGLKRFDWGLNATLSLALAGLSRGDKVGVAVFDRDVTTWISPERGNHHLSKLVDRLTPIQPILLEPDYLGAVTKVITQQTRRALVMVITDIVDATASSELLGAMIRLTPRYLPFCVTLRDPLVDRIAHSPTDNTRDTYSRAVALDLLAQRQVAFAQLRQRGVLVLDAPCDRISEELVDRYLQLKARNLL
ncbi:DUF58 domain-containing protein [Pleurocapsa sp. PCC 7319]|uniref:DUF58 domain-containing protein n=1 Tax=Pleurocapsa sp. PCC 7319 TaxID=118161 RepID=UPI000477CC22|nr:DUF58 domain-containing protein [Pleurocapsa sp. PCC 7319]